MVKWNATACFLQSKVPVCNNQCLTANGISQRVDGLMIHMWKYGLHHLNAHKMFSYIISGQIVGQICNSRVLFLPLCQQNLDWGRHVIAVVNSGYSHSTSLASVSNSNISIQYIFIHSTTLPFTKQHFPLSIQYPFYSQPSRISYFNRTQCLH